MTSPIASKGVRTASSTTGAAVPVALCVAGFLLALPEALLARHDLGSLSTTITLAADIAAVCAGLLLGSGVASLVLRPRPRSRRMVLFLAIVSLVLGLGVLVLANLVPPPPLTTPFLTGPFTENGALNALYVVGIVGSGAAALRFAARLVTRSARRARP